MFCGAADTPFNQVTKPHVTYNKNEKLSPLTNVVIVVKYFEAKTTQNITGSFLGRSII
jgi:hypothetical protein